MSGSVITQIKVELEGKTYAVIETETRDYDYYSKAYTRKWGPKKIYKREGVEEVG